MWYVASLIWCLIVVGLWLLAAMCFVGWGLLSWRCWPHSGKDEIAIDRAGWLGVCCSLLLLQIVHLAIPINTSVLVIWFAIGAGYTLMSIRTLWPCDVPSFRPEHSTRGIRQDERRVITLGPPIKMLTRARHALSWRYVVVACCIVVILARVALDAATYTPQADTYHFVSIRWAQTFPVVKGLANLDGRLGFNNASFLLQALFTNRPLGDLGFSILHGSLFLLLLGPGILGFVQCSSARHVSLDALLSALTIVPLLFVTSCFRTGFSVGGIAPDGTLLLMQVAACRYWVLSCLAHAKQEHYGMLSTDALLASFLFVSCAAVKLSAAVFSTGMVVSLLVAVGTNQRIALGERLRTVALLCLLGMISGLVWTSRSILLSGYPAYPAHLQVANFDWQVPAEMRREEVRMIRDWARLGRDPRSPGEAWFSQWMASVLSPNATHLMIPRGWGVFLFPMFLCGGSVVLAVWRIFLSPGLRYCLLGLLACSGASLAIWFCQAPDPRFAAGVLYGTAVILWSVPMSTARPLLRKVSLCAMLLLSLAMCVSDRVRFERARGYSSERVWANTVFFTPPNSSGRYHFPEPTLEQFRTDSGLEIYVSDYGWTAPLMTAETLYSGWRHLRLRDPERLSAGLRRCLDTPAESR